jgi:hypothetical protein
VITGFTMRLLRAAPSPPWNSGADLSPTPTVYGATATHHCRPTVASISAMAGIDVLARRSGRFIGGEEQAVARAR